MIWNTNKKINYDGLDDELKDFYKKVDLSDNENNKMNRLKSAYTWVLVSSANSNRFSLTLRAGIPFLVLWGISDTETLTNLTGEIGNLVVLVGQVVTGLVTAFGLLRKLWFSMKA